MKNIYNQLLQDDLIKPKQFEFLEAIHTKKIVSIYMELRLILYLGILLFTGGIGYYAYQNLGDIGHILAMVLISISIIVGFYFIKKFAKAYSNLEVNVDLAYFDYLLILISLLIVSLFTYVQVYFDLVALLLNWTSFIAAIMFIFMAYRYDNRALLSMGIVALAAGIGLSVSPINWIEGNWVSSLDLYIISILFGAVLIVVGQISQNKEIKKHFRFTYQNFGLVLFYSGCVTAMFSENIGFAIFLLISAGMIGYYTWDKKEFLFFLYSSIAGYLGFTYLVFKLLNKLDDDSKLWAILYYIPITSIAFIIFILKNKHRFYHD